MKKILVILCSMLIVFVAACSSGNNENGNNNSSNGENAVTENGNNAANQPEPVDEPEPTPEPEPVEEPAPELPPALSTKAYKGTPTVDGKIDDVWNSAAVVETNQWVQGTEGATAKFRTLWDDNNLYVLAEVTDSNLSKASANAHEQDSVEIFVDLNNGKTTTYEGDDAQYRINFDNEVSTNPGTASEFLTSATATVDGGYIVEAAIKWNGVFPVEGFTKIGFDAQVNNDEDGDGVRDSVAIWNDVSGNSWQNTLGFGVLEIAGVAPNSTTAVKGTPTVDGKIDDAWNSAKVISTDQWVQGTEGATAKFRTMWDDGFLYVLAEVTDSNLSKASANAHEQDSVEIFVDLNNGKTSTYEADDGQFRINFDNEATFNPAGKESLLTSATATVNGGYIVEAAIAWDGVTPVSGLTIGFDAQVNNDEDGDGVRDSVAIWNDVSGNSWQNMAGLGVLTLE